MPGMHLQLADGKEGISFEMREHYIGVPCSDGWAYLREDLLDGLTDAELLNLLEMQPNLGGIGDWFNKLRERRQQRKAEKIASGTDLISRLGGIFGGLFGGGRGQSQGMTTTDCELIYNTDAEVAACVAQASAGNMSSGDLAYLLSQISGGVRGGQGRGLSWNFGASQWWQNPATLIAITAGGLGLVYIGSKILKK
jgi:hypothetical protein